MDLLMVLAMPSANRRSPDFELQHFRRRKIESGPESAGDWSSFLVAVVVDSWRAAPAVIESTDKADRVVGVRVERPCVEVTGWAMHMRLPCYGDLWEEAMEL